MNQFSVIIWHLKCWHSFSSIMDNPLLQLNMALSWIETKSDYSSEVQMLTIWKISLMFMEPKRGRHVHKITPHTVSSTLTLTLHSASSTLTLLSLHWKCPRSNSIFALTKLWCEFKSYGQQQRLVQKTRHAIANVDRLHIWNHKDINDREIKTWRKHSARVCCREMMGGINGIN